MERKRLYIELRQQNENVQLYNLYVGYDPNRPLQLRLMALSLDEAKIQAFEIIQDHNTQLLITRVDVVKY
jgi:hypothetical protein